MFLELLENQYVCGKNRKYSSILNINKFGVVQSIWFMPEAPVYVMHLTILLPVSVIISTGTVHSWFLTCLTLSVWWNTYSVRWKSQSSLLIAIMPSCWPGKKVIQLDFRALEIPRYLPQTWFAPRPLSSPLMLICQPYMGSINLLSLSSMEDLNCPYIHPCGHKAHSVYL